DDAAGSALVAGLCDLTPQKNIFAPLLREASRDVRSPRVRSDRSLRAPGSRQGRRVTTGARWSVYGASPLFMLSPMRTADHGGGSLQGKDWSDAWATMSQDASGSAIASGPDVRPFPGELPRLAGPLRNAACSGSRDGRFDMIHPRSGIAA